MNLGDIRRLTSGLSDEAELEIIDESTEETYGINEIKSIAFGVCDTESKEEETGFCLQFTTNVALQSAIYIKEEE